MTGAKCDLRNFYGRRLFQVVEKVVQCGDGVHVLDVADVQEAVQVSTRLFSGTTGMPSEGGLDWRWGDMLVLMTHAARGYCSGGSGVAAGMRRYTRAA